MSKVNAFEHHPCPSPGPKARGLGQSPRQTGSSKSSAFSKALRFQQRRGVARQGSEVEGRLGECFGDFLEAKGS